MIRAIPIFMLLCHWEVLASVDFTTIEIWTKNGLVTCYPCFLPIQSSHPVQKRIIAEIPRSPWRKMRSPDEYLWVALIMLK
jgi:hypothetical protein